MTRNELILAARMLTECADHYGNHCCNDVDELMWHGWTIEERQKFVKEYYDNIGEAENYDCNWLHLMDWTIMAILADKLVREAENGT